MWERLFYRQLPTLVPSPFSHPIGSPILNNIYFSLTTPPCLILSSYAGQAHRVTWCEQKQQKSRKWNSQFGEATVSLSSFLHDFGSSAFSSLGDQDNESAVYRKSLPRLGAIVIQKQPSISISYGSFSVFLILQLAQTDGKSLVRYGTVIK